MSVEGKVAGYVPLPAGLVLASRLSAGAAKPLDETGTLLPNRRFFAGGVTTMRGYKRTESIFNVVTLTARMGVRSERYDMAELYV